jgi:hypothetical protein
MHLLTGWRSATFDEQWAKLLADDSLLKKAVLVDGKLAGNICSWSADGKA